jgi:prepilin-type N-terminal cleavage/methylation domain-containing protein
MGVPAQRLDTEKYAEWTSEQEGVADMALWLRRGPNDDDRGFTLIELLVVIVIIGILAGISVAVFLNQRHKAGDAAAKSDLRNLADFEEIYLNDFQSYGTLAEVRANEPDVKASHGVTLTVVGYNGQFGFCLSAQRVGSPNKWFYDSQAGGLQPSGTGGCPYTAGRPGGSITGS